MKNYKEGDVVSFSFSKEKAVGCGVIHFRDQTHFWVRLCEPYRLCKSGDVVVINRNEILKRQKFYRSVRQEYKIWNWIETENYFAEVEGTFYSKKEAKRARKMLLALSCKSYKSKNLVVMEVSTDTTYRTV